VTKRASFRNVLANGFAGLADGVRAWSGRSEVNIGVG